MNYPGRQSSFMAVRAQMLMALIATGKWMRFFSVLCFLGALLMLLPVVGMSSIFIEAGLPEQLLGGVAMYLIFLAPALMYCVLGWMFWRCASAIKKLSVSRSTIDFEAVTEKQTALWLTFGIILILNIVLSVAGALVSG